MTFAPDYVQVPERIKEWYARHPEGRIVCEVVEFTDARVTVKASAYRTPDPAEPPAGVGHSYLGLPGTTSFTRGSELENAETSAAGRALVMAGIPAKAISSEEEIESKSVGESTETQALGQASSAIPAADASPTSSGATSEGRGTSTLPSPDASGSGDGDPFGEAATVPATDAQWEQLLGSGITPAIALRRVREHHPEVKSRKDITTAHLHELIEGAVA